MSVSVLLVAAFVEQIAFGPQLLNDLLHIHCIPYLHAVGERLQALGSLGLGLLLLTADNVFAAKSELGSQHMQFLGLVELGVAALKQGLALQVLKGNVQTLVDITVTHDSRKDRNGKHIDDL